MAEPSHPIAQTARLLIAIVFMPALVILAWSKAAQFDPYTMSFFTKTYIAPTADMPFQFRMAGLVFVGVGALLLALSAYGLWRGRVVFREIWMMVWMGLMFAAFGGSFFLTADRAEKAISARGNGQ